MNIFKSKAQEEKEKRLIEMMEQGAQIIDVRSPEEYARGNVEDSVNIPLGEIPQHEEELKKHSSSLILCCASGNRSGQAVKWLQAKGISCENGGSWRTVNKLKK